jgi:hypothetical protein
MASRHTPLASTTPAQHSSIEWHEYVAQRDKRLQGLPDTAAILGFGGQ